MQPRRCPKCSGQLFPETVYDLGVPRGVELDCLQCGYVEKPAPLPRVTGNGDPGYRHRRLPLERGGGGR